MPATPPPDDATPKGECNKFKTTTDMRVLECPIREMWIRVMKDAKGGMLPSEAANFVGGIFKVPSIAVLLIVGNWGMQHAKPPHGD